MPNPMTDAYAQYSYSASSGVDMVVTLENEVVGDMQGITIMVAREKGPVYVMGDPNPRGFTRGKRGISGSLVALVFDQDAIRSTLQKIIAQNKSWGYFVANRTEINHYQKTYGDSATRDLIGDTTSFEITGSGIAPVGYSGKEGLDYVKATPLYLDQIPPFTLTLTSVNEAGYGMRMYIIGAEILNAGTGASVDDMTVDTTCTFIARGIIPWHPLKPAGSK